MKNIKKTIFLFACLVVLLLTSSVALAVVSNKKPTHNPPMPEVKQIKINYPENLNNANGVITAINSNSITLSFKKNVRDKNIQTKTITFNDKTRVNIDLATAKISDLKVGDNIRVNLELMPDRTYVARSIRVMTAKTNDIIKQIKAKEPKI